MTSGDKLLGWLVTVAAIIFLGVLRLNHMHSENTQRIAAAANQRAFTLQLELEQAKAQQMQYRALEVGYLCTFTDKTGEVYFNGEC